MSKNIEIEAKAMLKEEDYLTLVSKNNLSFYTQDNYYIDDKDISHATLFGLRVRVKDNKYELTLKTNLKEGKLETNQYIDEQQFLNIKNKNILPDGDVKNMLVKLNIDLSSLKIFGMLRTYRSDITYKTSLISIDKNEFNGKVDYEIEAEDTSIKTAQENLVEFLNKNMVHYLENHVTKLARLIRSL